jgi:hypothetical protein
MEASEKLNSYYGIITEQERKRMEHEKEEFEMYLTKEFSKRKENLENYYYGRENEYKRMYFKLEMEHNALKKDFYIFKEKFSIDTSNLKALSKSKLL